MLPTRSAFVALCKPGDDHCEQATAICKIANSKKVAKFRQEFRRLKAKDDLAGLHAIKNILKTGDAFDETLGRLALNAAFAKRLGHAIEALPAPTSGGGGRRKHQQKEL